MTEEEKAKAFDEWGDRNIRYIHEKFSLGKVSDVLEKAFYEGIDIGFEKGIKAKVNTTTISDAPLAGLHEGQPKWHKYPNEKPDEGTYLVVWQNEKGYKEILIMKYEEDDEEEFHWVDGDYECHDDYIIAWTEIPQFKE